MLIDQLIKRLIVLLIDGLLACAFVGIARILLENLSS